MVAALIASVIAFQLNATMLIPAIHTIDEDFGRGAFAATSTYFSPAGAVSSVVLIRWSDYVGRKRVMIVMCVGTVLYIVGTALGILVVGRILQGGSVITSGLAFLITREHLSGPAFGTCCGLVTVSTRSRGVACAGSPLIGNVIQITFLRLTVREKPRLLRGPNRQSYRANSRAKTLRRCCRVSPIRASRGRRNWRT